MDNIKVCVCVIDKNDNRYIREFIEYYKKIGVDRIFLYDNNDIENFEDVISEYIDDGFVVLDKRFRGLTWNQNDKTLQTISYNLCYNEHKHDYDFFVFVDSDEYVRFDGFNNIKDFLKQEKFSKFDSIRICWKLYDDNGLITVKDGNYSITRFTHPAKDTFQNTECKSIIRGGIEELPSEIKAHGCDKLKACDVYGQSVYNDNSNCSLGRKIHEICWIDHYRYKTISEFIDTKRKRELSLNESYYSFDKFFEINEKTPEKEKYIEENNI